MANQRRTTRRAPQPPISLKGLAAKAGYDSLVALADALEGDLSLGYIYQIHRGSLPSEPVRNLLSGFLGCTDAELVAAIGARARKLA